MTARRPQAATARQQPTDTDVAIRRAARVIIRDAEILFPEALLMLRKAASLSQEALADRVGVTRNAVAQWETGRSLPRDHKLVEIEVSFDIAAGTLKKAAVRSIAAAG